jgi:hypothetical protein
MKRNNTVCVPLLKVAKAIRRALSQQGITEVFPKKIFKAHLHWQKLLRKTSVIPYCKYTPLVALATLGETI